MTESTSTQARELALKFVYQCDTEKLYYFSDSHFNSFISFQEQGEEAKTKARVMCEGVFTKLDEMDEILNVRASWDRKFYNMSHKPIKMHRIGRNNIPQTQSSKIGNKY